MRKNKKSFFIQIINSKIENDNLLFEIFLERIPSVNIRLILHKYSKRLILNRDYRDIKNKLIEIFSSYNLSGSSFSIEIEVIKIIKNKPGKIDIDNILKILLDSISVIIGGDDTLISNIHISRKYKRIDEMPEYLINLILNLNNKKKKSYGYLLNITLSKIK